MGAGEWRTQDLQLDATAAAAAAATADAATAATAASKADATTAAAAIGAPKLLLPMSLQHRRWRLESGEPGPAAAAAGVPRLRRARLWRHLQVGTSQHCIAAYLFHWATKEN